jgi:hypothetical protein
LEGSGPFLQNLFADFAIILNKTPLRWHRTAVLLRVRVLAMLNVTLPPLVVIGWPFMEDDATARTVLNLVLPSSPHQSWN